MNTYKVYLSDGNDVLIYAAVLSVYDAEATFYDKGIKNGDLREN